MMRLYEAALLCAAMLLPLAAARAEEGAGNPIEIPEVRSVETSEGVALWLRMSEDGSKAQALQVRAEESAAAVLCPIPESPAELERFRIGLLPDMDDEARLESVRVVTWRKAKEGEAAPKAGLRAVSGALVERIETSSHVNVRPVWRDTDDGRELDGFEISVLAAPRKSPPRGGIDPTAQPSDPEAEDDETDEEQEPVHYRKIVVPLPATPAPGHSYGVILTPVWKKAGATLAGFDAILASKPAPEKPAG